MINWREQILEEFTPKVAKLTLVADPDGLLLEEKILEGIRERGFEILPFDDPVAFRYVYESRFRRIKHGEEQADLVVLLQSQADYLDSLPYDLLRIGRKLSFSLGDIFSHLNYNVVTALDRGDLDALFEAQKRHVPGRLGENATKEFVLRHVFEIAPELIKSSSDLLRVLLRRHYQGQSIPSILDAWFIRLLRQNTVFGDWPLETIVSDREAFLIFLQERWPIFLDRLTGNVKESGMPFGLSMQGPVDLPFDHHDIRVYINNLFIEGMLSSVSHTFASYLAKTWASIGVRTEPSEDKLLRLNKLIEGLQEKIPTEDARHTDWFQYARNWAELVMQANSQAVSLTGEMNRHIKSLQEKIDNVFTAWLKKRFAGLINLPPNPPVMLHHLPRFLSRLMHSDNNTKIALIVVDGLAMDQWLVVREALNMHNAGLMFREQTIFAWVPSLTSISRQAVFAGKAPIFFPNSIHITDKEPALWRQFWTDEGFHSNEVFYAKGLGGGDLESVSEILSYPKARIVGLVIDKVDKIMHGMEMGTAGMHNQVRQWAQQPHLNTLLNMLLDKGFCVYLTSDHGNIEAEGLGRPEEGAMADLRGERVRIYPDHVLRNKVKDRFPGTIEWQPLGLPDHILPLLAEGRYAFIRKKERAVCHGGITVEELIVPLVKIERKGI